MNDRNFLNLVRKRGRYQTSGEASRAANAVFGSIKAWMTPGASDKMRRVLAGDALQLWQYSPVASMSGPSRSRDGATSTVAGSMHFVFRVQQLGRYGTWREARRAICSVLSALSGSVDNRPEMVLDEMIPGDILGACASDDWPMVAGLPG